MLNNIGANEFNKGLSIGAIFVLATLCAACSSMKENGHRMDYQSKAQELLPGNLSYTFNQDSSKVLCQSIKTTEELPNPRAVHYVVLSLEDMQLLHEAQMANGTVDWYDNDNLLLKNRKNFPQGEEPETYLYNVITKSRKLYTNPYPSQQE